MENAVYFDGHEESPYSNTGKKIYHYTSPCNLLSIINNSQLWFSDSQFMNDRSEYVYIKHIFEQAKKGTAHENNDGFIDYLMGVPYGGFMPKNKPSNKSKFSSGIIATRYYVFCASLNSDNHSIWNYYVKNDNYQGYNLSFSVDALINTITELGWKITHGVVNYDKKEQIQKMHQIIIALGKEYETNVKKGFDEDQCIDHYQEELSKYLTQRCMFYKNPAFAHEEEYRIIVEAPTNSMDNYNIDHHVGQGGLIVPHLVLPLNPIQSIQSITLAPTMEREVAALGIQRLLTNRHIITNEHQVGINFSKIDVRF